MVAGNEDGYALRQITTRPMQPRIGDSMLQRQGCEPNFCLGVGFGGGALSGLHSRSRTSQTRLLGLGIRVQGSCRVSDVGIRV